MLYPSYIYNTKANQLVGSAVEPAATLAAVDSTVRDAFVAAGAGQPPTSSRSTSPRPASPRPRPSPSSSRARRRSRSTSPTWPRPLACRSGRNQFATWNHILFHNVGVASTITVAPGASNPLRNELGGTSPTMAFLRNDVTALEFSGASARGFDPQDADVHAHGRRAYSRSASRALIDPL